MRNSWLNKSYLETSLNMKLKIVFITACTLNKTVTDNLNLESKHFKDVLQASYVESYENNTYKAMTYLK